MGALGSPLGAPGSLLGEVLGALGDPGDRNWMIFWVRGACQCQNTKNLELDDLLHRFPMFLGPQGLENEVKMVLETRKESREERKEQRRERRERHRGEKCSILVTVCVSRVPGPPPKLLLTGPRPLVTAWVFEGLASTSAVSLRFRLDSRFL